MADARFGKLFLDFCIDLILCLWAVSGVNIETIFGDVVDLKRRCIKIVSYFEDMWIVGGQLDLF